ncbi:MAG: ABC transporter permease subunit, partial [Sphingopyxis terrae]
EGYNQFMWRAVNAGRDPYEARRDYQDAVNTAYLAAFVAAVGFGPLPGVLALGVHSTGMLGKLFFEAIEHVDPAPGAALRAHGASRIGVFRFAILPQALPRLADAVVYRFEHNLRAATTLGLVGAGGLGLEIVTAFHLFEYREASALIIVLLGLVTAVNFLGAAVRRRFLSND